MDAQEAADAFAANLDALENPDLTVAAQKSVQALLDQTVSQFIHSLSPDGDEWLPPSYRERPPNTLILTGRMLQELLDFIGSANVHALGFDAGDAYAQLPHYAKIMNEGGENERGIPIPKREFLGWSSHTIHKAEEYAIDDMESQLFGAWR